MKFLIVGEEFMWTSGAYRLQEIEMEDVRVFCSKQEGKEHLQGIIKQVQTLEEGLRWIGRDGYIVSEDEADMTPLRKRGFKVYGGNAWTKRVENDRQFEMDIAKKAGILVPNSHHITSADEGIAFIKKHPDQYALKQEGHAPKTWNFVGKDEDGSDVIDQLEWIKNQPEFKKMTSTPFMLQEFVEGLELAVGAWWMRDDWKRDDAGNIIIEINREHKKEGDGDTGRTTGEMGTVARFTVDQTKLFEETLDKLTPVLKKNASDVVLDIDANCGVTEDGEAYLYELTPREGYPACALQQYLLNTKTSDFFAGLIDGEQGGVEWKDAWGVIAVVGAGQFPAEGHSHEGSMKDQPVKMEVDEHVAPFYVKWDEKKKYWRIADYYEYVAGVCFHGNDIIKTNEKCVKRMKEIDVRAIHFRTDIGTKFAEEEIPKLKKMGFL
jgi:phosphoribosylamine---glycine ligase